MAPAVASDSPIRQCSNTPLRARSLKVRGNSQLTFWRGRPLSLSDSKLWAALTYLRDVQPSNYQVELQAIWAAQELRLHLRIMLIEFLGQQSSPTTVEAAIFEQALNSSNRRVALQAMAGSSGWLKLFGLTHVAAAMVDTDVVNAGVAILDRGWSFAFDVVKTLIKTKWLPDTTFDPYTWTNFTELPKVG